MATRKHLDGLGHGEHGLAAGRKSFSEQKHGLLGSEASTSNVVHRNTDGPRTATGKFVAEATVDVEQTRTHINKGKSPFVSFFKDNRIASDSSMLKYIAPPLGEMEIGLDEIDTVEKTFGYCLVGFVMGPRPKPFVLLNFVKRWGRDVKFTLKENGWIKFQFPNEVERDMVLHGGPYMIMGRHLFLKKLTSCFLYSKEDMVSLPSWVQIHGLPADCWTNQVLSRIASVVGKPIHTDKMTNLKKGHNYARVLVELDVTVPRIMDYLIKLPTGNKTLLKFVYETQIKFCDNCNVMGHNFEMCTTKGPNEDDRGNVQDRVGQGADGFAQENQNLVENTIEEPIETDKQTVGEIGLEVVVKNDNINRNLDHESYEDDDVGELKTISLACNVEHEDENSVKDLDDTNLFRDVLELDSDDGADFLSRVVPQDQEEWQKQGKNNKKIAHKRVANNKYLSKGSNVIKKVDGGSV